MQVDVRSVNQLDHDHWLRWQQIQKSNPLLASPYFCPEFIRLVATVRNDIYVAILQKQEQVIGFFPFQRSSRCHARPVSGPLSDYQGIILEPDWPLSPLDLLQQCGLQSWEFDHLLAQQKYCSAYWKQTTVSPILDLSQGFEAYYQNRLNEYPKRFKQIARSARQLAKEVGELRYESHVADLSTLHQLLEWKSEQCRQADIPDIFGFRWTRQLVEQIHRTQTPSFAGMLSVLYAGQEVVAAHMGMRSDTVWHYWFPSYDHRFKKYSPGLILLLEIAQDAANRGMHTVDLGKGDVPYKQYFSNGAVEIAEGLVFRPSLLAQLQEWASTLVQALATGIRHTPLVVPARSINALIRQHQQQQQFR